MENQADLLRLVNLRVILKFNILMRVILYSYICTYSLVEQTGTGSCQEIVEALNINLVTAWNYLKRAGYKKKLGTARKTAETF